MKSTYHTGELAIADHGLLHQGVCCASASDGVEEMEERRFKQKKMADAGSGRAEPNAN
jgi:hypothetical protein